MTTKKNIRTFSELSRLDSFEERFEYLRLRGEVGAITFGFDRILNQMLYTSVEWKRARREVIIRDNGLDLGIEETGHGVKYSVSGIFIPSPKLIIHHMNPITVDDVLYHPEVVFDPEFLITTIHDTHNAIHYGSGLAPSTKPVERRPNDTIPWRK